MYKTTNHLRFEIRSFLSVWTTTGNMASIVLLCMCIPLAWLDPCFCFSCRRMVLFHQVVIQVFYQMSDRYMLSALSTGSALHEEVLDVLTNQWLPLRWCSPECSLPFFFGFHAYDLKCIMPRPFFNRLIRRHRLSVLNSAMLVSAVLMPFALRCMKNRGLLAVRLTFRNISARV